MSDHFPTFSLWASWLRRLADLGRRLFVGPLKFLGRAISTRRGLMVVIPLVALALVAFLEFKRRERIAEVERIHREMIDKHDSMAFWAEYTADRVLGAGWWANVEDPVLREAKQAEFLSIYEGWANWHTERRRELWKIETFDPELEKARDARRFELEQRQFDWMSHETARLLGQESLMRAKDSAGPGR